MENQGEYNFQKPGKKAEELKPQTISIDQQIEFVSSIRSQKLVFDPDSILKQVEENLISIKRWNQNTLWSQLDIDKVLKDLSSALQDAANKHGNVDVREAPTSWLAAIENAEAALGMLKAFKEKRDKRGSIGTPLIRKYPLTENDVNSSHGFTEGSEL